MASKELRYTISGDARDFTKTMRTIDRSLAASESHAHKFGRGLSSAFHGIGSAAGVAGAAIGAGLVLEIKSAVTQFQESNKIARQTQAVLKSTGGAAKVTAKEVSNLATQLSRKTGIDDEVIQSGENMLLTFRNIRNETGKGNDIFNQSTKILLDMSTALGQDSTKSAIQLGKALNDPLKGITALRKVGVTFTAEQQVQIKALVGTGNAIDDLKTAHVSLTAEQKNQISVLGDLADPLQAARDLNLNLTDAQKKQLKVMEDGSGRMKAQKIVLGELNKEFKGSAAAQATSTEKLKVAFGNLQEDIGSGLAPAVDAIAGKLTSFAIDVEPKVIRATNRIAKAFGRKDLSLDQKFRLSYDEARQVFKPLIDEAQASVGKMHLGDKLSAAVSLAIPKILETFAAHGPKAAELFVKGFINAGIWTRLFAVGWLLKKTGGLSAFRKIGATAAAETVAGYAASGVGRGATTGVAGAAAGAASKAGTAGKLLSAGRGIGAAGLAALGGPVGIGAAAALILGPSAVKVFFKGSKSVQQMLEETDAKAKKAAHGSFPEYRRQLQLAADDAVRFGSKGRKTAAAIEDMANRVENAVGSKWIGSIRNSWDQFEKAGGHGVKATRQVVDRNMQIIRDRIGTDTDAGRRAMSANFREAAQAVKRQMNAAGGATKSGTHQIRQYLTQALQALGLTAGQASAKVDHGTLQQGSARVPGQGLAPSRAVGGWIGARGQRGGDNIPIMVGAGEAVLNRHQQAVIEGFMGGGFLDKLFATVRTPHYMAKGGRVRPVGMDTPTLRYASGGVIPHLTVNVGGGAGALSQRAVDVDRREALRIYDHKAAMAAASAVSGGAGSTTGLAPQVKRALAWARAHGWTGSVSSGFRSRAKQQYLWDHRASNPNPVAPPGTSMHERGLAVDVSDTAGFQRAMSSAPPNARLIWYGPGDPVHFSTTGHAIGGRVGGFASGGKIAGGGIVKTRAGFDKLYKAIWASIRGRIGAKGENAPPYVIDDADGYAGGFHPDTGVIHIGKKVTLDALRTPGYYYDYAFNTLIHEMVHARQKASLLLHGSTRAVEGGAVAFSHEVEKRVAQRIGASKFAGDTTEAPDYEKYGKYAERRGKKFVDYGQFGLKPPKRRKHHGGGGGGSVGDPNAVIEQKPKARLGLGGIAGVWVRNGGDPDKASIMAHIAMAESHGDPEARNPSGATGLWQILGQVVSGDLTDPDVNAANAIEKSKNGTNLRPWDASRGVWSKFVGVADVKTKLGRAGGSLASGSMAGPLSFSIGKTMQTGGQGYAAVNVGTGKIGAAQTKFPSYVANANAKIARAQAPWDQQDTDLRNQLIVQGIGPDTQAGIGIQTLAAQTRLTTLRAQKRQLIAARKAAKRVGNKKGVRNANKSISAINSQILAQRASITGLGQSYKDAGAAGDGERDPGPTQMDFASADLSLAQLNDNGDPQSLIDNVSALEKIRGLDQGALNDAQASGDPRKIAEAADALKGVQDNIQQLNDTINANTEALKQQQADLATELKRQNDITQTVYGSQTAQILKGITDMVSGQIGGQVGLGLQTPGFPSGRVRY